ncbi:MAG: nodulation protein NfeD [Burkholderiaceae bacterium]|nr:nodulation protein NfeD [Burkholderiaceae bacterium]
MMVAYPSGPKAVIALRARRGSRQFRILVRMGLLMLGLALAAFGSGADPQSRSALVLTLDGPIGPAGADYVARGIAAAQKRGAGVVVLRLDTPGGLDTSMREIIRAILAAPIPVLTWVGPSGARAASAGTYILYASHVAAMAPGTNLGAATPVSIGGGFPQPGGRDDDRRDEDRRDDDRRDGKGTKGTKDAKDAPQADEPGSPGGGTARRPGSTMEAKVINDAVAYIRSLAELRGRNADWAESAVRESASLSAEDARTRRVIDLVATSVPDLLEKANGRQVSVGERSVTLDTRELPQQALDPDWRTRLLGAITNPNVALILMMIGFYGLVFEFMNPGALYPGTIGAISLLLGLYALSALPVNYAGIALIVLGLALMIAEAFTPSVGVLGIGGAISFMLGATILIDTELPGFGVSWPLAGGIAATGLAFSLLVVRLALRSRGRPVATGHESLIGERGTVLEWTGRGGRVLAAGERWKAESAAPMEVGQPVRVTGLRGLVLQVEPERPPTS